MDRIGQGDGAAAPRGWVMAPMALERNPSAPLPAAHVADRSRPALCRQLILTIALTAVAVSVRVQPSSSRPFSAAFCLVGCAMSLPGSKLKPEQLVKELSKKTSNKNCFGQAATTHSERAARGGEERTGQEKSAE